MTLLSQLADVGDPVVWLVIAAVGLLSPLLGDVGNRLLRSKKTNQWGLVAAYYAALVLLPTFLLLLSLAGIGSSDFFMLPILAIIVIGPIVGIVVFCRN